jgi:hypothetical protein
MHWDGNIWIGGREECIINGLAELCRFDDADEMR